MSRSKKRQLTEFLYEVVGQKRPFLEEKKTLTNAAARTVEVDKVRKEK